MDARRSTAYWRERCERAERDVLALEAKVAEMTDAMPRISEGEVAQMLGRVVTFGLDVEPPRQDTSEAT